MPTLLQWHDDGFNARSSGGKGGKGKGKGGKGKGKGKGKGRSNGARDPLKSFKMWCVSWTCEQRYHSAAIDFVFIVKFYIHLEYEYLLIKDLAGTATIL